MFFVFTILYNTNSIHKKPLCIENTKGLFVRTLNIGDAPSDSDDESDVQTQRYYLYGQETKYKLSEINTPMYIQIKDGSNIRLHKMIKAMGGTLAYRKVDCAVTVGGNNEIQESKEW